MKRNFSIVRTSLIFMLALIVSVGNLHAQNMIIRKGKPKGRIVVNENDDKSITAARLMQRFLEESTGARMPIIKDGVKAKSGDIFIRTISADVHAGEMGLRRDGFLIRGDDSRTTITGLKGNGVIYGVISILEDLGIRYWSENEYDVPKFGTVVLPSYDKIENPDFSYRQSMNYAIQTDPVYKLWMRLDEPEDAFAANYWVHTFDPLLPASVYGESHPEYYSYFKGKRHPGRASQWCLSNPEVLEIVTQRLDSIFKANPGYDIISVSQNDSNFTNCQCDDCAAIDEYEGAPSGSMIHFMNKLAARFPDKTISTLAYLYTMHAPKYVKPLPNVNIMLCSIDCNREVTLTENESGRTFVKAMEDWSAISDNIFVWDYGINFDNYLAPFPNFHVLGDNIRLFLANGAKMHFSQIASSRGGDFAELRTWLVARLMWDSKQNTDELIKEFLGGYYGAAAPHLYKYIKVMEGALIGSGERLWIYDSPVSHKTGMLKPELMRRYNNMFDAAEKAVATDRIKLARVQRTRVPLQFAEIEIARTETTGDAAQIEGKLALLEERIKKFGIETVNERGNDPLKWIAEYRERYMRSRAESIAKGAKIIYVDGPHDRYAEKGMTALTDGLFGGNAFVESWVGWEGTDGSFIVDMGEPKEFSSIESDFLHQLGQWVMFPKSVTYSISADGKDYTEVYSEDIPEEQSLQVKFRQVKYSTARPQTARYIKVDVTGIKICPSWHYGVGNPCWFFIDEVSVY